MGHFSELWKLFDVDISYNAVNRIRNYLLYAMFAHDAIVENEPSLAVKTFLTSLVWYDWQSIQNI